MLRVLCGISNSGKSTYAQKLVQENPDKYIVVNRDKIREMLFGFTEASVAEYYSRKDINKLEKTVSKYEDTLINEGLSEGKCVVVDATHLELKYLKRFEYWNVPIEYVYFDISLEEAIDRNSRRDRKVGVDIIVKQYNKYTGLTTKPTSYEPTSFFNDPEKPNAIIYDIDGTLAEMVGRSPYDWDKVDEDKLVNNVSVTIDWIRAKLDSYEEPLVFICTGRDGVALQKTEKWLRDNNVHYDGIFIREKGDTRPDWVVKEEMWEEIAENHYIVGMYDDRQQVVRRARALGLTVFNVKYNNF